MDFRRSQPRRARHRGPDGRRLARLVLLLGLAVIASAWAADSAHWRWLWSLAPSRDQSANDAQPIDTRLPASAALPGTIRAPAQSPPSSTETAPGQPLVQAAWSSVRDDRAFDRREDAILWALLAAAQQPSAADERATAEQVTFAQLFRQSALYRGRRVAISGIVRRVVHLAARGPAAQPIGYFQLWLQPDDHPGSPLVVFAAQLPEGFPQGHRVREEVRVAGVYFKRWPYEAADGLRTAPLIVAGQIEWQRPVAAGGAAPSVGQLVLGVAAAAAASAAAVGYVWLRTRSARRGRQSIPEQLAPWDDQRAAPSSEYGNEA